MIHAKNYESGSKFVKVSLCLEYCGLFFPDTVYILLQPHKLWLVWAVKICNSILNMRVYVFSDLLPLRHVSMRAVNDNDHVYHVCELTCWRRTSDCDACLGMFPE